MKKKLVSVIMPTANRYKVALENVLNIVQQNYKPLEVIVCDDSNKEVYLDGSGTFRDELRKIPDVKYVYCARYDIHGNKDYGLARARNYGVIESEGEFLVFLDDRITPAAPNMVDEFVTRIRNAGDEKVWFFGEKGANKQSFVENCSAIRRSLLVDAGMFFERIDQYGGMSREIIGRFTRQGFRFQYVPEALAKQVCKSSGWDKKPEQIGHMKKLLERLFSR